MKKWKLAGAALAVLSCVATASGAQTAYPKGPDDAERQWIAKRASYLEKAKPLIERSDSEG